MGRLELRVSDGLLARLDEAAVGDRRSRSGMARVLIEEALAARGRRAPRTLPGAVAPARSGPALAAVVDRPAFSAAAAPVGPRAVPAGGHGFVPQKGNPLRCEVCGMKSALHS